MLPAVLLMMRYWPPPGWPCVDETPWSWGDTGAYLWWSWGALAPVAPALEAVAGATEAGPAELPGAARRVLMGRGGRGGPLGAGLPWGLLESMLGHPCSSGHGSRSPGGARWGGGWR